MSASHTADKYETPRLNADGTEFRLTRSVTYAYYNTNLTKKEEFFDEVEDV